MNYTKGPWVVTKNSGEISTDDGFWVARAINAQSTSGQANANLIAAAPELLEALQRAQEELRLIRMKDTGAVYDVMIRTDIAAAIAKANGK